MNDLGSSVTPEPPQFVFIACNTLICTAEKLHLPTTSCLALTLVLLARRTSTLVMEMVLSGSVQCWIKYFHPWITGIGT